MLNLLKWPFLRPTKIKTLFTNFYKVFTANAVIMGQALELKRE